MCSLWPAPFSYLCVSVRILGVLKIVCGWESKTWLLPYACCGLHFIDSAACVLSFDHSTPLQLYLSLKCIVAALFIAISLVITGARIAACLVTVVTKRVVATKRAAADNPFRHVYIYKETKAIAFSEISCCRFHEFPARRTLESVSYKTCSPCCYRFCTINRAAPLCAFNPLSCSFSCLQSHRSVKMMTKPSPFFFTKKRRRWSAKSFRHPAKM